MKFKDLIVNRAARFSLGVEEESGRYFLSIPVRNDFVEYEEYYALAPGQFERFQQDCAAAVAFASACRQRENDALLMVEPGSSRGVAS